MARVRISNRDRIEEVIHEIFDTFYTWPIMLPQELVYFFRASVLLEGSGFGTTGTSMVSACSRGSSGSYAVRS